VRYTGNHRGEISTPKWIGSIFRVTDRETSWDVVEVLHREKPFVIETCMPSFYKFNAEIIQAYETKSLDDELFELE